MKKAAAFFLILAACNQGSDLRFRPPGQASTPPAGSAPASELGWEEVKLRVLAMNCLGCHGAGNEKGLTDLSNPEVVRNSAGTIFFVTSVMPSMPPLESGIRMSDEKKQMLANWIIKGMPEVAGGPAVPPSTPAPEGL